MDVAKIKEDYFTNSDLRTFDFVVSGADQPVWLVQTDGCGAARDDLREWERVFGPGFMGLVAVQDEYNGTLTFPHIGRRADSPGVGHDPIRISHWD